MATGLMLVLALVSAPASGDLPPWNDGELLVRSSEKIANERCRRDVGLFLEDLGRLRLWATEMFDATSKLPSGILAGSTYGMGNFDECLKIRVPLENDSFSGKYCLATLKIGSTTNQTNHERYQPNDFLGGFNVSVWERVAALSKDRSKMLRNEIKWAFCIPSSCRAEDLLNYLKELSRTYASHNFTLTPQINEQDCQIDEGFILDPGDITFVVVILTVLVSSSVATVCDLCRTTKLEEETKKYSVPESQPPLWKSLSLAYNLKKLITQRSRSDGLDCVNGLKVFSMFFIIMGHRIMFYLGTPMVNSDYVETFYGKVDAMVLLNGPIIVDTFFFISGFLACYLILEEISKRGNISFIKLYLHRLVRLLPPYAIILACYCTLFVKMGSGPLWKERVGVEQERCRESWWANLLFINNYMNTDKICMFQSWYITCDIHLFIVAPLIVWLLWRKEKQGLLVLATLIVLSIASTFMVVYFKKLDAILLLYMKLLKDPIADKTFRSIYIPTHTRATPYFVGMLTGYVKSRMKKSDFKFSNSFVYPAWTASVLLMLVTIYSAYFFYVPGEYDVYASAVYAAFHHLSWSICISWFVLALSTGNGLWIEPILSWKGLIPLSRITYSAFLCHGGLQLYSVAISRQPMYASIFYVVWYTFADISIAFLLGLILSLLFESPLVGLEKFIFGVRRLPQSTAAENHRVVMPHVNFIAA